MYIKENLNPMGRKTTDCVIRAIAKASGEDYFKVLDLLVEQQKKTGYDMSEKMNYDTVLKNLGFVKKSIKVAKGDKRPTVDEIAKSTKGNNTKIVAAVAHHLVACEKGHYYDIWDCGDKSLYSYYVK